MCHVKHHFIDASPVGGLEIGISPSTNLEIVNPTKLYHQSTIVSGP